MDSTAYKNKLKLEAGEKTFAWAGNSKEQNTVLQERIQHAKNQRRQSLRRFDDLAFEQDYVANEDAITSYLRPKKNDDEVRVNTGTTEKKVEIIVNELLSYNFQHEIFAFDRDDMEIQDLGDDIGDAVTRTNEMEQDEDVMCDGLFEFVGQRAVFFEEYVEEKETNGMVVRRCKKRMLSGLQVFLGDIKLPHYRFDEQPYIVKYDKMNYWTAKMFYGHLKNWEFVMPGENMQNDWFGGDFNWRMARLDDMEVEIIRYESAPDNEYQFWINGVPMEEFGTKLPWKHAGYNTVMGVVKRLSSNLAYGRCVTSSLKYLHGFSDETVRNLIRKFRQAVNPPKAVAHTGKVYAKDIFEAGKITYGIPRDTFQNLVDHQGITQSDVAMLDIIERITNEFASSTAMQQGIDDPKQKTATAIIEQRKQSVKMLGLVVLGWTRVKKQLTYLRIYNLLENFTDPEGKELDPLTGAIKDIYQKFTVKNAVLSNEKEGTKVINFNDRSLNEQEEDSLLEFEQKQADQGNPTEIKFINAKLLKIVPITWFVVITPKEKEDSALRQLMFADKLRQGAELSQIIGEPLNPSKWKQEYQQTWRMNDAFANPQDVVPQVDANGQPIPQGMGEMGAQATQGIMQPTRKPGIKAIMNA